jgi:L-aspartate semialdehyde sulfurtransferase ferredoxin
MKAKYLLSYGPKVVDEPILWKLVKTYEVKINILRAEISAGEKGTMLVELEAEENALGRALLWLDEIGIQRSPLTRELLFRSEECVDCGACTGVCFVGALFLDAEAKLRLEREKCVACGACVKACPFGLFELDFELTK